MQPKLSHQSDGKPRQGPGSLLKLLVPRLIIGEFFSGIVDIYQCSVRYQSTHFFSIVLFSTGISYRYSGSLISANKKHVNGNNI